MNTSTDPNEPGSEPVSAPPAEGKPTQDACTWALLTHLSSLCGYIGVPFGHIVGPLVLWLIKRHDAPFIDAHGKEALNFNISVLIYLIIAGLAVFVLIGIVLVPVVVIAHIILTIIATMEASKGNPYRYPLTIRFIK